MGCHSEYIVRLVTTLNCGSSVRYADMDVESSVMLKMSAPESIRNMTKQQTYSLSLKKKTTR